MLLYRWHTPSVVVVCLSVCRRHTLFGTFLLSRDTAITVCCYWVLKLVAWLFSASKGQRSPFLGQKTSKSGLKRRISHVIGKNKKSMLKPVDTPIILIMMGYWLNFWHPKVKGHSFLGWKMSKSRTLSAKYCSNPQAFSVTWGPWKLVLRLWPVAPVAASGSLTHLF